MEIGVRYIHVREFDETEASLGVPKQILPKILKGYHFSLRVGHYGATAYNGGEPPMSRLHQEIRGNLDNGTSIQSFKKYEEFGKLRKAT